jgi:DNA-binding XRE family transcriptional regulator
MISTKTEKKILRLIRSGATVAQAAKETGVSRQTIERLAKRDGATPKKKPSAKQSKPTKAKRRKPAKNEKPMGETAIGVDWRALYQAEKHRLPKDTVEFLRDVLGVEDQDNFLIAATAAGFMLSQVGVSRALLRKYPFEV